MTPEQEARDQAIEVVLRVFYLVTKTDPGYDYHKLCVATLLAFGVTKEELHATTERIFGELDARKE
jgi:hypothetical protein